MESQSELLLEERGLAAKLCGGRFRAGGCDITAFSEKEALAGRFLPGVSLCPEP